MRRRTMLKGMAALIAVQGAPLARLAARAATPSPFSRVRPGDAAWPDAASWAKLNEAVGGNLIAAPGPFAACAREPGGAACVDAIANIHNPFFIGDQPGGTQVSGWFDAWTPAPSAYAVKARSSGDVAAAVNFARDNNLRLVVKGAGHSYQGTSNAPDSLLIWTRAHEQGDAARRLHAARRRRQGGALRRRSPPGRAPCGSTSTTPSPREAGRYVQGGGCTDVGVAGLVQSGGFDSFSKGFGTAAAGLLEAEIVTADGAVRDRERLHQSGPVLGAQGRRRRQLGRGHAAHAAHARPADVLRRRAGRRSRRDRTTPSGV